MSTRLGAAPRTPTLGRSKIRRFGTVLSVNSPGVTPSVQKKTRALRNDALVIKQSIPEEETTSPFPQPKEKYQFTVTFDAGPIGLQIDPATCRVQCILGDDSPARTLGMILQGDAVVAVNGRPMLQESAEELWNILQNVKTRRSITFEREVEGGTIVPVDGPENRSPSMDVLSPLPPPRSILFLNETEASKESIPQPALVKPVDNTDELALTRRELLGATNLLQQMQTRLDALEAENAALKNAPPKPYPAIRDMEYKMRIQSLEDQLQQSNASRSKLKEQLLSMDQRLLEQSEHHKVTMDQTNQELQKALAQNKETSQLLDSTRKELTTSKKEWQDEVNVLQRERDQLLERVDQHASELERSRAAKVQSDVRLQQMEENRSLLEEELQRSRAKVEESDLHAQQNSEQLLHTIRTKDVQIEGLRMELVALQTANDTLQTDLSEKDAVVRQVMADTEQRSKDQQSLHQELMNMSSLLEMSHQERERLEGHIAKLEDKLTYRNQALESMKVALKQVQDDHAVQLAEQSEAMAALAESIDELYREKELLMRQLVEARATFETSAQVAQQLRESLATTHLDLSNLRNAASSEKCDLLKRLEELEGAEKASHATILRQEAELMDAASQLHAAEEQLERASSELKEHQQRLQDKEKTIQGKELEIVELKQSLASKEILYSTTIQGLHKELEQSKISNDNLTTRNINLTRQFDTMYKSMMSAVISEIAINAALKNSQMECESLKLDICRISLINDELQGRISSRDATIKSLRSDLASALSSVESLQMEKRRLTHNLAKTESLYEESLIELVRRETQYQSVCNALHDQKDRLCKQLSSQAKQIDLLNRTIDELTTEAFGLRNHILELNADVHSKESLIAELQLKVADMADENEKLQASVIQEKNELTSAIASITEEFAFLQARLQISEKDLLDKTSELVSSKMKVENLELELITLGSEIREAQAQVEERNLLIESLNQTLHSKILEAQRVAMEKDELISDLQSQIEKNEANLLQSIEHAKTIEEELFKERSELSRQQENVTVLKAALEESQLQLNESIDAQRDNDLLINSLNESIKMHQQQLVGKADEFNDLVKTLELFKVDSVSLREQLSKVQADYNFVSGELKASLDSTNASNTRILELEAAEIQRQRQFETVISEKLLVIQKLTEERDSYLKILSETRDHVHRATASEKNLRAEVEQLKFQLANSEADFQKCNELLDTQTRECEVTKQSFIDQKLRCEKLLQELKQSESSLDSFSRLVDNQNSQIASLKRSFVARQADHDRELLKTQMESQDRDIANRSLTEMNLKLTEQISALETTISKANEAMCNLKRRIDEMESEHSITVTRANKNEQKLLKRIDDLCQDITNMQSMLAERETAVVDLKHQLSSLTSIQQEISDRLSASCIEKQEMKRSALHFELFLEVAKRNHGNLVTSVNKNWTLAMDSVKQQYEALLADASHTATATKDELDNLKLDFTNQVKEVKSLHGLLSAVTSEKESLASNIANVEAKLRQCESDLSEAIIRAEAANKLVIEKSYSLEDAERRLETARISAVEHDDRFANLARDLSETRSALVAEKISLKEEIEALKLELNESGSVIISLTTNQTNSELLIKQLEEKVSSGNDALNEVTAKSAASLWALECELEASKSEVNTYRDSLQMSMSECNDLRTELSVLQLKFNDVTKAYAAAKSKFDSTESSLLKRNEELFGQVESANNSAAKLTEELRLLKLEHESIVSTADSSKRQLEETLRYHHSEASVRSERQAEWNKKLEEAQSKYHRSRSDLDSANDKIAQLEGLLNNRNEEIQRLSSLLEKTIEENIASIESTSQRHSSEISRLKSEIEEYDSKIKSTSAAINSMTSRLHALENELSCALAERNDLLSEKNSLLLLLEENKIALADLQRETDQRKFSPSEPEIVESPFKSLSKHEIKDRCLDLQSQLKTTQTSLNFTNEDLSRRSEHVKQLARDLDSMSIEIGSLVTANEMLETRLKQVTSLNASLEAASSVASNKINFIESELHSKSKKLEQLSKINGELADEIQSLRIQVKSDKLSFETEKSNAVNDLAIARQELEYAKVRRDEAESLVSKNSIELNLLCNVERESKAKIEHLELDIAALKSELTASSEQTDLLRSELKRNVNHLTDQRSTLEAECEKLRSRLTALQLDIEEKDVDLRDKEEKIQMLSNDLLKQRQLTLSADQFREDVVSKLSDATRVITSQRCMIKKLESRAIDAERNSAHLSEKIDNMLSTSEKIQANADESDSLYVRRNLELEHKLKELDEARASAVQRFKSCQDELQKVKLELVESETGKAALLNRFDELKISFDTLKAHLSESRIAQDDSLKTLHQMQAELDNKQMDIDHLKAALQVSAATSARLKATALLQDSEPQTDGTFSDGNRAMFEIAGAPSDQARSKTLQQALRIYEKLEEALMLFVDNLLADSDNVVRTIAALFDSVFQRFRRYNLSETLNALDLAGVEPSSVFLESLRSYMDRLSTLVASYFEGRRSHVLDFRDYHTSQKEWIRSIVISSGNDTVERIDLFNDDLSSRVRSRPAEHPDMEFFKSVIISLEENIDALLADLKAANESLQEKDLLLAKLESLVSHYESMERASDPLDVESQSSGHSHSQHKDPNACKMAAGRLILQALDGRAQAAKAIAFRQWACQTSAMSALAKHGSTAAALAQQLEETREKLVVLKRHLKKSRRSSAREYSTSLDRIEEHESEI